MHGHQTYLPWMVDLCAWPTSCQRLHLQMIKHSCQFCDRIALLSSVCITPHYLYFVEWVQHRTFWWLQNSLHILLIVWLGCHSTRSSDKCYTYNTLAIIALFEGIAEDNSKVYIFRQTNNRLNFTNFMMNQKLLSRQIG